MVRSRPTSDAHKDAILRAKIENKLQDHLDGKKRLSPTQLKASELLYARLRPVLSAVEQTVTDARDSLSEDQLLAQLSALFASKPALLARINAIHNAAALVSESESAIDSARTSQTSQGAAPAPVGVEPPKGML